MEALRAAWIGALCTLVIAFAPSARAECVASPQMTPPEIVPASTGADADASGAIARDDHGRVIAPIMVNGQGPFPFIVDTGANRSALGANLATRLGLVSANVGLVHSINSVDSAPLAPAQSLSFGQVSLNAEALPILGNDMLGVEAGVLGVDGMRGKRLRLDFQNHCIEIISMQRAGALTNWAHLRGTLRFGQLVMLRGHVDEINVNVLLDTGSDVSLANLAFREAAVRRYGKHLINAVPSSRIATAGQPIILEDGVLTPALRMGDVTLRNIGTYTGDYHIFNLWGLQREPTLLIGMDVLSRARAIAIDYTTGTVHFQRRD